MPVTEGDQLLAADLCFRTDPEQAAEIVKHAVGPTGPQRPSVVNGGQWIPFFTFMFSKFRGRNASLGDYQSVSDHDYSIFKAID